MKEEKKDYDEAHEADSTASEIAKDVTSIQEGVEEVSAPVISARKARSLFNLSEAEEEKPSNRKAFTLFPNL